jgi:hypothetical protein
VPSGALPFVLVAAVAAIALWVVVRFPALGPRTAVGITGWLTAAVALTCATRPVFGLLGPIAGPVLALVLVEVTSGVCMMLAVAWTTLWVIHSLAPSTR